MMLFRLWVEKQQNEFQTNPEYNKVLMALLRQAHAHTIRPNKRIV